jgi:mxaJ protein
MCSRFLSAAALACVAATAGAAELRVCADPDNLPYSKADGSGFENRLASLVAAKTGRELVYFWLPDRRGFLRKTLGERSCDVVVGVVAGTERAATTPPYYRASWVLASRHALELRSLDDVRLPSLRIGVPVGGELTPALALAERGIVDRVVGFAPFDHQPVGQRMIEALDAGTIDAAVLWGPQAGYFADRAAHPIALAPIADADPFRSTFSIAMGVRRGDEALRDELARALRELAPDIEALLASYHVPRIPLDGEPSR